VSKDVSAMVAGTAAVGAVVTVVVGEVAVGVDIEGVGASATVGEAREVERVCSRGGSVVVSCAGCRSSGGG
jgi:hypothetical protein